MTDSPPLDDEIRGLARQLVRARDDIERGATVDLTPLESAVQAICHAMENRPASEQERLKPGLLGLLEELNRLADDIRKQMSELAARLGETADRRRAHSAYASKP